MRAAELSGCLGWPPGGWSRCPAACPPPSSRAWSGSRAADSSPAGGRGFLYSPRSFSSTLPSFHNCPFPTFLHIPPPHLSFHHIAPPSQPSSLLPSQSLPDCLTKECIRCHKKSTTNSSEVMTNVLTVICSTKLPNMAPSSLHSAFYWSQR